VLAGLFKSDNLSNFDNHAASCAASGLSSTVPVSVSRSDRSMTMAISRRRLPAFVLQFVSQRGENAKSFNALVIAFRQHNALFSLESVTTTARGVRDRAPARALGTAPDD
jgi:hypothetical protein